MVDVANSYGAESRFDDRTRQAAYRAAARHSSRVRWLRRFIILGAVGGPLAVVGLMALRTFGPTVPNLSLESLGLDGARITMDKPRLSGFRSDGRPYSLNARTAVQDARTPNLLELHEIDAHVTLGDRSVVHVASAVGVYDSSKETMTLSSDVHLTSDGGYDARMKSAFVNFKTNSVETHDPLTIVMSTGTVSADSMHMQANGTAITFEGHVHSTFLSAAGAGATPALLKGSAP